MFYIGIDLGTSAVKLILMDESGKVCNSCSKEYKIYFPHTGWAEQNPDDWYRQTIEGISELIKDYEKEKIKGIGIAGQMHGLVVLDCQDRVLRPAILWNDGRTEKETAFLNETIGIDKLANYTGNIAFAGFTAPKLLWMKEHETDLFARIEKIMLPKDYLLYRMTGVHATDYSDASGTLLLDVEERCWSKEMLEICSVSEKQLPRLQESSDVVGTLNDKLAKELGLAQVLVVAGAADNAAAAVGTGTVGNGTCNISLGTSGTIFIANDKFYNVSNHALHSFAHADGRYHLMGCMLSAASCNKWWCEDILKTNDYEAEQRQIQKLGENEVFYLPYLMGERCPHNTADARAAFLGMSMNTTREEMTQAVLEGVAFGLRDALELAREAGVFVEESTVCGGGAKSRLWLTMLANIMNLKIHTLECEEGPGYGAALLAAVGCGTFKSVEETAKMLIRKKETIEPEQILVEKYEEKYRKYKSLYPLLKNWFV